MEDKGGGLRPINHKEPINYKKGKLMRSEDVPAYLAELQKQVDIADAVKAEIERLSKLEEMKSDTYYERKVEDEDLRKYETRERQRKRRRRLRAERGIGSERAVSRPRVEGEHGNSGRESTGGSERKVRQGSGGGNKDGKEETREANRKASKAYYEARKNDPEFIEKKRENRRKYYERQKTLKDERAGRRRAAGTPNVEAEMLKEVTDEK